MNGINRINEISLPRDNTDLQFSERILERLHKLESFISRLLDETREFASVDIADENGKIEAKSVNELEAFSYIFGGSEEITQELEDAVKNAVMGRVEAVRSAKAHDEREAARIAKLVEKQECDKKKREELTELANKRARESHQAQVEAQRQAEVSRAAKKKAYEEALEEAEKNEEDVYVSGGRMKKLAD